MPAGETCENATSLAAPASIDGTTAGYFRDYGSGTNCSATAGSDRVYAVQVPPNKRLTASVLGAAGFNAGLSIGRLASACLASGRTCLAGADSATASTVDTVTYSNRSDAFETIHVFVGSASAASTGGFNLVTSLDDAPPIPAGDVCQTAPLVAGGTVSGTTVGYANDYGSGTGCTSAAGPDRTYRVSLPAGHRLTATVAPTSSWDPSVNLMLASSCEGTRTCVAASDLAGTGGAETARFTNVLEAATDVYVVVESLSPAGAGTFDLATTVAPAGAAEICSSATPIGAGTVTGTTIGFENDYGSGSGCAGTAGAERFYRVTVPAGQKLVATVVPTSAWDPSINLMLSGGCGSPRICVAGSDSGFSGDSDSASFTNSSAGAVDVFVAVESFSGSQSGPYTLTTSIGPP